MRIKALVYVRKMKTQINRTIRFNDDIEINELCERIIIAMNGRLTSLFQLVYNEEYTYLSSGCSVMDYGNEEMMRHTTVKKMNLKVNDKLLLDYNFRNDCEFLIVIEEIDNETSTKKFEVINGKGVGIIETLWIDELKLAYSKKNIQYQNVLGEVVEGDITKFKQKEYEEIDEKMYTDIKEKFRARNYILDISLRGFEKAITRKVAVDSNVNILDFCENIIRIMNGDLYHAYCIKRKKEILTIDELEEMEINTLELNKGDKLSVIYDYGDNWEFIVKVKKINEGYGNKRFELLEGNGFGIVEDCGGIYGLIRVFEGTHSDFEKENIDDFDLDKTKRMIYINY